jgi:hypothetical protein
MKLSEMRNRNQVIDQVNHQVWNQVYHQVKDKVSWRILNETK